MFSTAFFSSIWHSIFARDRASVAPMVMRCLGVAMTGGDSLPQGPDICQMALVLRGEGKWRSAERRTAHQASAYNQLELMIVNYFGLFSTDQYRNLLS